MRDYIAEIADILSSENGAVIVYSVGGDTINIIRSLNRRYGLLPTAICDKNPAKQGHTYQGLFGLCALSPEEAIHKYPNAQIFVSSLDYKYQIIGELMSFYGVSSDKIINFEPVSKRRSCGYIEKSLICNEFKQFSFCWYQPPELQHIPFNRDYLASIEKYIDLRDRLISHMDNGVFSPCENCQFYCTDWYPVEQKIRWINFGIGGICNLDCHYCNSNARTAHAIDDQAPELDKLIEILRQKNLLGEDYGINIAPGEPTIHPSHDRLFAAMDSYSNVVNTNLVKFSEPLYKLAQEKFSKIVVSLDSGTRQTFKTVKGRDHFDRVCENLKKFARAGDGIVVLKYVFIPGLNDIEEDVDAFTDICIQAGIAIGNISYDYNAPIPIPQKTSNAMRRLKANLDQAGIIATSNIVYSASSYVSALQGALG